jgi:hypothetical protein
VLLRSCIRRDRLIGFSAVDLISFLVEECVVMVERTPLLGMASLECLDCRVADVEWSVIWKLVLVIVIVSLLLVGYLRVVLSYKEIVGISTCRLIALPSILYHASLNLVHVWFVLVLLVLFLSSWRYRSCRMCLLQLYWFIIVSFYDVFVFSYSCFNFLRGLISPMYRCGQSLQGIMYRAFFVCFDAVLSLCFVNVS